MTPDNQSTAFTIHADFCSSVSSYPIIDSYANMEIAPQVLVSCCNASFHSYAVWLGYSLVSCPAVHATHGERLVV